MKPKKLICLVLVAIMCLAVFAGCNGSNPTNSSGSSSTAKASSAASESKSEPQEIVNLKFYMMNSPVNEQERIMTKANEIINSAIGVNLEFVMVDGATYAEKMNLMINGGDEWDLCFTASWGGINFFENATKGAYADLTELIPQYAPETYARIPEGLWDGVKVNGKIYALVNYQQWGVAARKGYSFRKDLAEEVGFDWKAVKDKPPIEALKLIDPFIGASLAKHPDMIGWETSSTSSFFYESLIWDMEAVGDVNTVGWIRFTEPTTVINQYKTEEFTEYCNIMRDWYNKGYVRKDGATLQDFSPDRKAAKMIAAVSYGWPDTLDCESLGIQNANTATMSMCTPDVAPAVTVSTTRTVIPAAAGSTAAIAINAKTPNIVKSLQLVELLNTNDELYFLITQGEKDIDFTYMEDGNVKLIDGKYNFNYSEWQVGQSYSPDFTRSLVPIGELGEQQKKSMRVVFEADLKADVSPVSGFTFDQTKVKTQLANCQAVLTEVIPALSNGSVDPVKTIPEFLSRLEAAGVNDIIAEKQAQLDAWRAANGK